MVNVDEEDMIEYYLLSKGGNLDEYETRDFLKILTTQRYKKLPYTISMALMDCLESIKFDDEMEEKIGYSLTNTWSTKVQNYQAGVVERYEYERLPKLPFAEIDKDTYINFFTYFMEATIEDYYNRVIHAKLKGIYKGRPIEFTEPLVWYRTQLLRLIKTIYWYVGKRETDTILESFNKTFFTRVKQTEYSGNYSYTEINEVMVDL